MLKQKSDVKSDDWCTPLIIYMRILNASLKITTALAAFCWEGAETTAPVHRNTPDRKHFNKSCPDQCRELSLRLHNVHYVPSYSDEHDVVREVISGRLWIRIFSLLVYCSNLSLSYLFTRIACLDFSTCSSCMEAYFCTVFSTTLSIRGRRSFATFTAISSLESFFPTTIKFL